MIMYNEAKSDLEMGDWKKFFAMNDDDLLTTEDIASLVCDSEDMTFTQSFVTNMKLKPIEPDAPYYYVHHVKMALGTYVQSLVERQTGNSDGPESQKMLEM